MEAILSEASTSRRGFSPRVPGPFLTFDILSSLSLHREEINCSGCWVGCFPKLEAAAVGSSQQPNTAGQQRKQVREGKNEVLEGRKLNQSWIKEIDSPSSDLRKPYEWTVADALDINSGWRVT